MVERATAAHWNHPQRLAPVISFFGYSISTPDSHTLIAGLDLYVCFLVSPDEPQNTEQGCIPFPEGSTF